MIDQLISNSMSNIQSEPLTKLMIFITNIGDKYTIALFSAILLAILLYKKEYVKTKIFIIAMAAGTILSQALKYIAQRTRPETMIIAEDGFSMPSGHATLSIIFFGMVIYLFKDKIKNKILRYIFITANILLIISISFSRLYLNVHWATDVLVGLTLGLICILGSIWVSTKIPYLNKNKLL